MGQGLSFSDEGRNKGVKLMEFFRGKINASTRRGTEFCVSIVGILGAVEIEIMGTAAQFWTGVAYVGRFFKKFTFSSYKRRAERGTFLTAASGADRMTGKIATEPLF